MSAPGRGTVTLRRTGVVDFDTRRTSPAPRRATGLVGPAEQKRALVVVAGQRGGLGEGGGRLLAPPGSLEQVAADARHQVGAASAGASATASRTARPASGPKARPWATARLTSTTGLAPTWASTSYQPAIAAQSVSSGGRGAGVAGGDLGLEDVGADRAARAASRASRLASPRRMSSWSQRRAVLVLEEHRAAVGVGAGGQPRGLELHQRQQAVDVGLERREAGEHPGQPDRPRRRGRAASSRRRRSRRTPR